MSAIACISMAGLLDVKTLKGTSDGDTALSTPQLMPYNSTNPHSVVIMDNCSIHHVPEVVKSIQDVGALLYFLPPYSSDFAPIEETFSKVKQAMKSIEKENTQVIVKAFCYKVSWRLLLKTVGWIKDCGIYNV